MNGLLDELMFTMGCDTPAERQAWQKSLPRMFVVLAQAQRFNQEAGSAHPYLGG